MTDEEEIGLGADPMEPWLRLSGIELIRAMASGNAPPAPYWAHIGLRPTVAEDGRVELRWTPTADVASPTGAVHGGYVSMVLDDACCIAAATLSDPFLPMLTLSLNIDFLRPMSIGATYDVTGVVAHSGKRRTVANASIRDAEGTLTAQATGSVIANLSFAAT